MHINLKEDIKNHLVDKRVSIFDLGPLVKNLLIIPIIKETRNRIELKKAMGIFVCGSGTGMAISANKIKN